MTALTSIPLHEYHPDLEHMVHPPIIEDDLATAAYEASCRQVGRFLQQTQLPKRSRSRNRSRNRSDPLLSLSWTDVSVNRILGVGGFAAVCLVQVPKLDEQFNRKLPPFSQRRRWYALKCLNETSINDSKQFVRAASDLAMEATLLSRLDHENIIQIYGETIQGHAYSKETFRQPGGYVLVLQCMKQTLDGLLQTWTSLSTANSKSDTKSNSIPIPSVSQRINCYGVGITNAMAYLHSKRILFRDLKPQNVGIDYDGQVRLFDFGIAQELPVDQDGIEGTCCGSLRYLAPEVLIHRRASLSSDVYSLGILLYHLSTLRKPYDEYADELKTPKDFRKQIGRNHLRPSIPTCTENGNANANANPIAADQQQPILNTTTMILDLMQQCWHACPEQRPTMAQVQGLLQQFQQLKKPQGTGRKPTTTTWRRLPLLGKVLKRRRNRRRVMEVVTTTTTTTTAN
jgi:serine/threonine protein kinase